MRAQTHTHNATNAYLQHSGHQNKRKKRKRQEQKKSNRLVEVEGNATKRHNIANNDDKDIHHKPQIKTTQTTDILRNICSAVNVMRKTISGR